MKHLTSVFVFSFALVASLLAAEVISNKIAPQHLSGSFRTRDAHGLQMNKSQGQSIHRFFDREAIYTFGAFGHRKHKNGDELSNTNLVLVVGDSFTFGWLLQDQDTFIYKLDRHYLQLEFFNAAAPNWGAADYTRYIETYCKDIAPVAVIVMFNADDIARILRSQIYRFDKDSDTLTSVPYKKTRTDYIKGVANQIPYYNWWLTNSNLFQLLRNVAIGKLNPRINDPSQLPKEPVFGKYMPDISDELVFRHSKLVFQRLATAINVCGAKGTVIYTGVSTDTQENPTVRFAQNPETKNLFESIGLDYFDLSSEQSMMEYRSRDDVTINGDGHPNEVGAELMFHALLNSGVMDRL